jgi:hypothetical protein
MDTLPKVATSTLIVGYAKRITIWLAAAMAALAVIDYIAGWRTLFLYAESLFLGGAAVMTIGAGSTMGHWMQTRRFDYQYASSVSDANLAERTQQANKDAEASYAFSTLAIITGLILVLLSILIHNLI